MFNKFFLIDIWTKVLVFTIGVTLFVVWIIPVHCGIMVIVVINKSLKVSDFNLFLSSFTFKKRIQLDHWVIGFSWSHVVLKKLLNGGITFKFVLGEPQNLKGLLFSHKSSLNPKSFLGYLLSTFITEFFHLELHSFFLNVLKHFFSSFWFGQGAYKVLRRETSLNFHVMSRYFSGMIVILWQFQVL